MKNDIELLISHVVSNHNLDYTDAAAPVARRARTDANALRQVVDWVIYVSRWRAENGGLDAQEFRACAAARRVAATLDRQQDIA